MVQAETVYVTDRLFVSIREGQGNEFPVVKSVATGTELEALQRLGGFVLVREAGGAEGWIAERYLLDVAPGKTELNATIKKLEIANNEVTILNKRLADSRKKTEQEKVRADALIKKLDTMDATSDSNESPEDLSGQGAGAGTALNSPRNEGPPSSFFFSWLWFSIAFAMLITGFVSGVIWLRELNRKKMGGMYLRV